MADMSKELCDRLDKGLNQIIEEYRSTSALSKSAFNGTVVGFMLKTGIGLAMRDGMSDNMIRVVCDRLIEEAFRS